MKIHNALSLLLFVSISVSFGDERFRKWDRDGDGKLSRQELPPGARGNFEKADGDGDGSISEGEHEAFLARVRPHSAQKVGPGSLAQGKTVGGSVLLREGLAYAGNKNPRQALDLLLPKKRTHELLPVLVFIHGGAWKQGNKRSGHARLRKFVGTGAYAGVSVGYRLSDEAQWPAQIHDCKAAIRWIRGNAKTLGLDSDRIAVWGTSAGGHLVAMLGTSGGVKELEGDLGEFDKLDSRVTCVVNFFGPSELLTMGDFPSTIKHNAPDSPESRLIGGPLQKNKEKARSASPVTHITPDDAPFLIVHGDKDRLVPYNQSEVLHARLREAGVESELLKMAGEGHGGFRKNNPDPKVSAYLKRHLFKSAASSGNETK